MTKFDVHRQQVEFTREKIDSQKVCTIRHFLSYGAQISCFNPSSDQKKIFLKNFKKIFFLVADLAETKKVCTIRHFLSYGAHFSDFIFMTAEMHEIDVHVE